MVGDFESQKMLDRIDRTFAPWRKAKSSKREFITYDPILKPGVYIIEQDLPQPAVRIYHQIPVDRSAATEDHAALEILNDILGGSGFRSRLMERLRSDEGLTYGVYSSLAHEGRPGPPGRVQISYQTKRESVAHSIDSSLEEFRRIIADKVASGEVEEQIEGWRNRFVFRYTDDFFIVWRLMINELDERPYDYDRIELDAVQKVSVGDVERVAKKYLKPENLTIAIFGKLTDEDRKALDERFNVTVLQKKDVFKGGYEETPAVAQN